MTDSIRCNNSLAPTAFVSCFGKMLPPALALVIFSYGRATRWPFPRALTLPPDLHSGGGPFVAPLKARLRLSGPHGRAPRGPRLRYTPESAAWLKPELPNPADFMQARL